MKLARSETAMGGKRRDDGKRAESKKNNDVSQLSYSLLACPVPLLIKLASPTHTVKQHFVQDNKNYVHKTDTFLSPSQLNKPACILQPC